MSPWAQCDPHMDGVSWSGCCQRPSGTLGWRLSLTLLALSCKPGSPLVCPVAVTFVLTTCLPPSLFPYLNHLLGVSAPGACTGGRLMW